MVLLAGERATGETTRAMLACNDWLRMGPGRSLHRLAAEYARLGHNVPTRSLTTLKLWSARYSWARRGEEYDAAVDAERTRYAESVMRSGLGLAHERVLKLKGLADYLESEIRHEGRVGAAAGQGDAQGELARVLGLADAGEVVRDRVWLRDVKRIGAGEDAETVEIRRFNSALIEQYRGVLDDLARETGGRNPRVRVAVGEGGLAELLREVRDAMPPVEPEGTGPAVGDEG